mmetsp:Transcript_11497/g.28314  ORF Transcript_11497/g.28314 Transcript_11497/m.28314 type:complete len:349 (-) Transcript_11497:149-1195(-)
MGQTAGCAGLLRPPEELNESDEKPRLRRRLSLVSKLVDTKGTDDLTKAGYSDSNLNPEETKAKAHMKCGVRTRKGKVPGNPNKVNQDRFIVKWGLKGVQDVALFGAFDGHGPQGHVISQYVVDNLPKYLEAQENLVKDPTAAILEANKKLCARLTADKKETERYSGTTAVYGLKVGNKLYVANIGDSRCVVCTRVGLESFATVALSEDHKPEDPEEKRRILAAGGRVHPLKGFYGNQGPHRVWLAKEDIPGLAMSRSIGDALAHSVGVSDIPDIQVHEIHSTDKFAVWASDGVWDFISNKEVAMICQANAPDMDGAAATIVNHACKMWEQNEGVIDDITCVVVQLNDM